MFQTLIAAENWFAGSFWALVPPIIAIALALITKEVYISLFVGILTGALFLNNLNPLGATVTTFETMVGNAGDGWNMNILVFLVILGILVALMNKAGGTQAYGRWASSKIKKRETAMLATAGLGALIFIDDYFNCLTVGSVMQPVTDKYRISRAKLAYLIDATAAPICIIAPISSWAAAVSSSIPDGYELDGFQLFLKAIPFNLYAFLTLFMIIALTLLKIDFGPMRKHETNAIDNNDLFTTGSDTIAQTEALQGNERGKVLDLILPIAVLIVSSVLGLLYTGGLYDGVPFLTAFADCDASQGLVLGGFAALLFTFIYYMIRKVITFKQFTASLVEGFKAMVPAIFILIFAWTLGGVTSDLGAAEYVGGAVKAGSAASGIVPAIIFLVGVFLAFSTGTSWGTFAILLPIVVPMFAGVDPQLLVISIAAALAGGVCGDHCSPISDTTIMASTGAGCDHVSHVNTQLPYSLTVAAICFIGFIVAGFSKNVWVTWLVTLVLFAGALCGLYFYQKKKGMLEHNIPVSEAETAEVLAEAASDVVEIEAEAKE